MSGKAYRWLSALVIITLGSGCDNVDWGGMEAHLVYPPEQAPDTTVAEDPVPSEPDLMLPEGPVLFLGTRDGDRVTVTPAVELRGDSLVPVATDDDEAYRQAFAEANLGIGTDLVLFSDAVRVGRVRIDERGSDATFCAPRPTGSGPVELLPVASAATRFLALPAEAADDRPWGRPVPREDTFAQREASVQFGIDLLRQAGATFPPSLVNQRVQIEPFPLATAGPQAFTATFVVQDAARIAPADTAGYSGFVMGIENTDGSYRSVLASHRSVARGGKGVPLLRGFLDWNDDGENELLLEVLGAEARWIAAVARSGTGWQRVFEDPCGTSGAGGEGP